MHVCVCVCETCCLTDRDELRKKVEKEDTECVSTSSPELALDEDLVRSGLLDPISLAVVI